MQASLKTLVLLQPGSTIAGMTARVNRENGIICLFAILSVRIKLRMSTINGRDILGFVALRDPSRLITTSELSIISMLCPDKMLPSRSGTGAACTTAPDWGTSMLLLQEEIFSVT